MHNIRRQTWDLRIHFFCRMFPFLRRKSVPFVGSGVALSKNLRTKTEKPVIYNSNISSVEVRLLKDTHIYIYLACIKYFFSYSKHIRLTQEMYPVNLPQSFYSIPITILFIGKSTFIDLIRQWPVKNVSYQIHAGI